jgi:hypothetical protein
MYHDYIVQLSFSLYLLCYPINPYPLPSNLIEAFSSPIVIFSKYPGGGGEISQNKCDYIHDCVGEWGADYVERGMG